MTKQLKDAGTPLRRSYSKADKIAILKVLEKNDHKISKTALITGVSTKNIRRWKEELGEEVFSAKPTPLIMQRVVNESAKIDLVVIDNEVKRQKVAGKALDIIYKRLETKPDSFKLHELIQLSQLETSTNEEGANGLNQNSIVEKWTQAYTKVTNNQQ